MPTIRIPNLLRPYVQNQAEVLVQGTTVADALEDLVTVFPAFRTHLLRSDGSLHAYVNLVLDGQNIKNMHGLDTHLKPSDVLAIIPSIAGG